MSLNRRSLLKASAVGAAALTTPYFFSRSAAAADTIKVGVLFSLTGGLSIIEKSLADATMLAISEINAAGGVMGRKVEAVMEDGASDPKTYNEKASKLVVGDKLSTVFGSYTSASRKAVLPVFEKHNAMYFYPTYYEGFECSRNVVYTGAVPNQQLSNFIPWIVKNLGKKKFFIVGSNYIYPREMAKVCKILMKQNGAEFVADEYLELGHSEWGSMVNKIKNSGCDAVLYSINGAIAPPGPRGIDDETFRTLLRPFDLRISEAVLSNVVGDSVVAFYREFKNQGLTHDKLPICATVTSEIEIAAMGAEYAVGSYTSFPYFMAIDTDRNKSFVERYRTFVKDPKAVTHHALESSYFQVFLWKQAVEKAKSTEADAIREGVRGQEFDAPNGHVTVDADNLHTYLTPRIAQWQPDGQAKIIDAYPKPVQPLPYVAYGETDSNLYCTPKGLDASKLKKS